MIFVLLIKEDRKQVTMKVIAAFTYGWMRGVALGPYRWVYVAILFYNFMYVHAGFRLSFEPPNKS